jgi:hypothetical protein
LLPGASLELYTGEYATEEGWDSQWLSAKWTGDRWDVERGDDGCDCDGRLRHSATGTSVGGPLRIRWWNGGKFNHWDGQRNHAAGRTFRGSPIIWGDRRQRDYQAEAAGY